MMYEDEVQSQDSTDTTHSELIPFVESQSGRESLAASSKVESRRDTFASFGSASNPPSGRKSFPSSLASFAGELADPEVTGEPVSPLPEDSPIAPAVTPLFNPSPMPLERRVATPAVVQKAAEGGMGSGNSPQRRVVARSSCLTSANLDLTPTSSISSPISEMSNEPSIDHVPASKSHPRIQIDPKRSLEPIQKRPWSELAKPDPDDATGCKKRKQNRTGESPASLFDDQDVYKVAHFIPKCSFGPANLVEDEIQQQLVMSLPNLKIVIIRLVPGQRLDDFVNPDGDITGHILRSQKGKVNIKIHVNEHTFSQGDYFYVPRGNPLSLQNKSERLAALLELVVTKACD